MKASKLLSRRHSIIGRTIAGACLISGPLALWAYVDAGRSGQLINDFIVHNVVLGSIGLSIIVWLAISKQPRNLVVWVLLGAAVFQTINALANAWTVIELERVGIDLALDMVRSNQLPESAIVPVRLATWTWVPGIFLLVTLLPLLFPERRSLSGRVRWVAILAIGAMIGVSVAFHTIDLTSAALIGDAEPPGWIGIPFLALLVSVVASLWSMVGRWRGSEGEARNQFRWVGWGASIFGGSFGVLIIDWIGRNDPNTLDTFPIVSILSGAVLMTSLTVAITRFGLYGIDVVINRTVMVGTLGFMITGLYIGVVAVVGELFGTDEINFDLQVAAAVLVAVSYGPARRRAKQWANRFVYGKRATPYEVLSRFSHRAAETSDEDLLVRIPNLIVEGTGAIEATIWVVEDEGFVPAATSPVGAARLPLERGDTFSDPSADYSTPVYHDGELLGGVSLIRGRGEVIPPAEVQLIGDLSAGLGLALRNTRLTRRLREQVGDLEASRERVLAAADAARRSLERDLDSGPQQQLVALKVMLGPTRSLAEQHGASQTAAVLRPLEDDAGDAIQTVRDFSGGVYPPLLEAEGLVVALSERAGRASLDIEVTANEVGRYSREIEAAVYFTTLEALQNTAKYAGTDRAFVALDGTSDGVLRFVVTDAGAGFDRHDVASGSGLENMADRLDALGGSLAVESEPGRGTSVTGEIPL